MCGGFLELFLAKDFGASCAEVKIAVCQEVVKGSGTDGKGEYKSSAKSCYDAQTRRASRDQACKGGNQGNGGS